MASEYAIELSDYLAVLWRRRKQIAAPAIVLIIVSIVAAYVIPPVYESTATILVESPEIPSDLVQTTVTGFVQERLQAMQARVLTDQRIWDIVEELDLYPEKRLEMPRIAVVELARASISILPVSVPTLTASGKVAEATIALEIGFSADSPETAQRGADYLSNLVLEVNKAEREQQVTSVSEFLDEQAQRLSEEIADLEHKLAAFKREEMDQLPELMELNLRQLEQTERSIEQTEDDIRALQDKQLALEAELVLTSPYRERFTESGDRVLSADEKLTTLTVQFLAASGRYSHNHPDMIRMRREIETLAGQGGGASRIGPLVAELQTARGELTEARRKYSDEHPDVARLSTKVSSLERSIRAAARAPTSGSDGGYAAAPDNPHYVVLSTQLRTTRENLLKEQAQLERLREDEKEYTRRLFQTPAVERDFLAMSRGYDSAQRKYSEIKDKQLQALLAERLEKEQLAERFTLLKSADLIYMPASPNRKAIVLVGAMLGLVCGIGLATVSEFFDGSVRGFKAVESLFGAPPLAAVRYIETSEELHGRHRRAMSVAMAICTGILVTIMALHFLWMPVEEIWQVYSPWAEVPELSEEET